jgi:hypothetical protein
VSLPVMQLKCGTSGNAVPTLLLKCGTAGNAVPTLLRKCEAPPLCSGIVSILMTFSGIELCTYTFPYPPYYWMNIITWPVVYLIDGSGGVGNPRIGPQCGTIDEWKWEYLWNPDINDYEWTRVFQRTLPVIPCCYCERNIFLVKLRVQAPEVDPCGGSTIFQSPDISRTNWVGTWANTLVECQSNYDHRTKDGSLTLELA